MSARGMPSPGTGPAPDLLQVGRRGPSRRTVLFAVVPLVLVLLAGVLVDQKARAAESERVDGCAARTHAAIRVAGEKMSGILDYVRPVWAYKTAPGVHRSLMGMVSRSADRAGDDLLRVRRSCAEVEVSSLHSRLRAHRNACVEVLDAYVQFLRAVTGDGSVAGGEWPEDDELAC